MINRRAILTGAGVAAGAAMLPVSVRGQAATKPPRLRLGDKVGLITPASAVSQRQIDRALHTVRGMGLEPQLGRHVAGRHGYLAGTDQERASDLQNMFADPAIRAVFAISGGWGCARLLPLLDWEAIRAQPKLLIGYSDITALHCAFAARAGFSTIHAPNAANSWPVLSWNSLWKLAFTGEAPVLGGAEQEEQSGRTGRTIRAGTAAGKLIGGNLTVISALMGTPWLPKMDGAILFLEDVREAPYRIDRMLQQMRLAGVFEKVAGIVFGQCSRCTASGGNELGFTPDEVFDHHFTSLGIPVFVGANIGHIRNQFSLPVGAQVEMDAGARTIAVREAIVA